MQPLGAKALVEQARLMIRLVGRGKAKQTWAAVMRAASAAEDQVMLEIVDSVPLGKHRVRDAAKAYKDLCRSVGDQ